MKILGAFLVCLAGVCTCSAISKYLFSGYRHSEHVGPQAA